MSGGWVGYVYVFFGCGVMVALVAASTLVLYGWARIAKRRGGGEPKITVTRLSPRGEDPDAPSAG